MIIQQLGKKTIKLEWEKGEYPIIFRDFAGAGDLWTPAGKRSFCLCLKEDQLELFKELGYGGFKELKKRDPEDEDEEVTYRLKVKVMMDGLYPPDIYMIKKGKKMKLDGETVAMLDRARISEGEMCVTCHEWTYNMSKGVNLILSNTTVVIEDSNYASKYDNIPMVGDEVDEGPVF